MGKIYKTIWKISMCLRKDRRMFYLLFSLLFWSFMGAILFLVLSSTGVFAEGILAGKALEAGIILIGYMALIPGYLGAVLYAYRNIPSYCFREPRLGEGTDVRPAHEQKKHGKYVEDHADHPLRQPVHQ